jgi:hypothetical protein
LTKIQNVWIIRPFDSISDSYDHFSLWSKFRRICSLILLK